MRKGDFVVHLKNFQVSMWLGIHDHEKKEKQRVLISVMVSVDAAIYTGDQYYDYDKIREYISGFSNRRIGTQENLISEIIDFIMSDPGVNAATVMSKKPDVYSDAEYVGVSVSAERS